MPSKLKCNIQNENQYFKALKLWQTVAVAGGEVWRVCRQVQCQAVKYGGYAGRRIAKASVSPVGVCVCCMAYGTRPQERTRVCLRLHVH